MQTQNRKQSEEEEEEENSQNNRSLHSEVYANTRLTLNDALYSTGNRSVNNVVIIEWKIFSFSFPK